MAQVFNRNGTYYARFMYNGKDYCRSTRVAAATGDRKAGREAKKKAEAELGLMLAEIRGRESVDALFDRLVEATERLPEREREPKRITLADRLRQGVTAKLAIADAWGEWETNPQKGNPSTATVEMYLASWGRDSIKKRGRRHAKTGFKNWLTQSHGEVRYLHEVTPGIVDEYATHLWGSGISPRTYNGTIQFLRSMFEVLKRKAGLGSNPWSEIRTQTRQTEGRRNLTTEELKIVCEKAEGSLRCWIAIGLYTGLRLGDVVTLKWDEIDFAQHAIKRVPSKTRRKGKMVSFPLHPVLETMLKELWASATKGAVYLFPEDAEYHKKAHHTAISKRVQDFFESCGIQTTEKAEGQRQRAIVRVGFHSLRHSFVSMCAARGVPEVTIRALVGHSTAAMTERYAHADKGQKAEAIAGLPPISFQKATTKKTTKRRKPTAKK